jgi:hypothetical protein
MIDILQMIQENFLTCNVYYVKLNKYICLFALE